MVLRITISRPLLSLSALVVWGEPCAQITEINVKLYHVQLEYQLSHGSKRHVFNKQQ